MNNKCKNYRNGELDALYFDKLPQRIKEIFFDYLFSSGLDETKKRGDTFFAINNLYVSEDCKSPIEQIFDFAFNIISYEQEGEEPISPRIEFEHQKHIKINNNNFYVDFYFDSDYPDNEYCAYKGKNHIKLIIECDGYEYHSTKEQIKKDNERTLLLKKEGYDILRFSGSQLYEKPIECAQDVYDYIQLKTNGWVLK